MGGGAGASPSSPRALSSFLGASPSSRSRDGSRAGSPAPELHTILDEGDERAFSSAELSRCRQSAEAAESRAAKAEKERRKAYVAAERLARDAEAAEAKAKAAEEIAKQALAHAEKLERATLASDAEDAEKETLAER